MPYVIIHSNLWSKIYFAGRSKANTKKVSRKSKKEIALETFWADLKSHTKDTDSDSEDEPISEIKNATTPEKKQPTKSELILKGRMCDIQDTIESYMVLYEVYNVCILSKLVNSRLIIMWWPVVTSN